MKLFMLIVLLFLMIASSAYSQNQEGTALSKPNDTENNGARIITVSISGLERTKPHVLERPLQKFIGQYEYDININEIYALIEDIGIFEIIAIEIISEQDSDGKILHIIVREKWTLIPVPYFSIDSDGWTAGLGVMNSNFLGSGDTALAVGNYGPNKWMAGLGYIHSPAMTGSIGWHLAGIVSSQNNVNTDQTGSHVLRRFNTISINSQIGLSYQLMELIEPGIEISYDNIMLRDTEDPISAPENNIQAITLSPVIDIRRSSWDGYFLSEDFVSFKYSYIIAIGTSNTQSFSLNAAFNRSIIPGFRITTKTGITLSTISASPFFEFDPGAANVSILPSEFSARNFAGISLGLEKYLYKFSMGTLSFSAAYQAVYSNGPLLQHQFDHGVSAMFQFYFRRLALPGMGLGMAYNIDKKVFQFNFSIGLTY